MEPSPALPEFSGGGRIGGKGFRGRVGVGAKALGGGEEDRGGGKEGGCNLLLIYFTGIYFVLILVS